MTILLCAFGATIALTLLIWILPALLNQHPSHGATAAERLAAANATRTALAAMVAALAAGGSLLYTVRTYALSKDGQLTDRFSSAVEHIGSEKLQVRVGGVYALERIMHDSRSDEAAISEVLLALIRSEPAVRPIPSENVKCAADAQAALRVLGRRPGPPLNQVPLNLSVADLRGADLRSGSYARSRFDGANLSGATLTSTDLRYSTLKACDLTEATLIGADLRGADLGSAVMEGADLYSARLYYGQLTSVQASSVMNANAIQWDAEDA